MPQEALGRKAGIVPDIVDPCATIHRGMRDRSVGLVPVGLILQWKKGMRNLF